MTISILDIKNRIQELSLQPPFPLTIQSDESECGLASLTILLNALECPVDLELLRHRYGSTRGGMTVGELIEFGKSLGLRLIPQKTEHFNELQTPSIIFVKGEHFAVLWKIHDGQYCVADPSEGSLVLSAEEFAQYFSGVSLNSRKIKSTFEHLVQFSSGNVKPSIVELMGLKSLASYFIAFLAIITTLFTLANAIAQDVFMTYIVEENEIFWTKGLITITISLAILMGATSVLMQFTLIKQLQKAIYQWNVKLFESILTAPYTFFCNKTSGLIASRFNQIDEAVSGFQSALLSLLIAAFNLIAYLFTVALVSIPLFLISIVGIAGFFFVGVKFFGLNIENNYMIRDAECASANAEFKLISNRDQIILENSESSVAREFSNGYLSMTNARMGASSIGIFNEFWLSFVDQLLNGFLLIVSALLITSGQITTGIYAAVSVLIQTTLMPVRSLGSVLEIIQNSRLSFNTAAELYQNSHQESQLTQSTASTHDVQHDSKSPSLIEIHNLSYRYSLFSDHIFSDANLNIASRSGNALAIRLDGGTGGGKTTFLNILLGMLKPTSGSIKILNQDIGELPRQDINKLIQYVDRYPIIVPGTVQANALLGTDCNNQDYETAISTLGLSSQTIFSRQSNRHLDGIQSVSVGQSVMISLVRSALLKPSLLLIDESLVSIPENLHQQIIDGFLNLGINLLIVQHGKSESIDRLPTLQLDQLKR